MRRGAFLAQRFTPAAWTHATRLSQTPRQCFSVPCAPINAICEQRRRFQSIPRNNDQTQSVQAEPELQEPTVEKSDEPSPQKDHSWVYEYTGAPIGAIEDVGTEGTEEFVTYESGAKLLCSWSVDQGGGQRTVWVPGDAPRVADLKLPVDLKPEAIAGLEGQRSGLWSMGRPDGSLEPFFASLVAMNPRANFDSTDIIADAKTLQLLMGVAKGNLNPFGGNSSAIAFNCALVNNTLLITRIANKKKHGVLGRGSTPTVTGGFLNKITELKSFQESVSPIHYQALRYEIGPLHCVGISAVEAATGNTSLPPMHIDGGSFELPGSVTVKQGGRGVPPTAATRIQTAVLHEHTKVSRVSNTGHLKIKPAGMVQLWLQRPSAIVQGHVEAAGPDGVDQVYRLNRVSVRPVKSIFEQIEDWWQLDFRRLVTILQLLRDTARKTGGSCILATQPPQKGSETNPKYVPAKFELYTTGRSAPPVVMDWHIERFWSKR